MADASVHVLEHVDFKDTYEVGAKEIRNCHLNVGTGVEVSIKELSKLVALVEGYEGKILFDTSKPDGTLRKLTDPSKLQALGWRHKVNVDEGVRRLFEWYKNTL